MHDLPSDIAEQGAALDLPGHLLQALLESLLALSHDAVERLARGRGQCKFSEVLAQGSQLRKRSLSLFSMRHAMVSSCTHQLEAISYTSRVDAEARAEMLVHVVHREHTLRLLRMPSLL
jgi:hypothetical protein